MADTKWLDFGGEAFKSLAIAELLSKMNPPLNGKKVNLVGEKEAKMPD